MKQHGDAGWSGHREISYAATDRLFAELAGPDGLIRGYTRTAYAQALDRAQAHQDRPIGAGVIKNFANSGHTFPYAGPGPTTHSAYVNPDVQREHFMADPYRRGADNLRTNAEYIRTEVSAALESADFARLGAAAHALQDSYSGAHAWRDDSVYSGNPAAAVQSLHVFTPAHALGLEGGRNTHSDAFDQPPAESGSTLAAIEATHRLLSAYERSLSRPDQAEQLLRTTLDPLFQPSPAGVTVNLHPTPTWEAERNRRLGLEHGITPVPTDELTRLKAVLADHGPATLGTGGRAVPDGARHGHAVRQEARSVTPERD